MAKLNLGKGKTVTVFIELLKSNIQYVILVLLVINLLYLSIYTNGKMDHLKENTNRLESELLSLRSMVQKETSSLEEDIKSATEEMEKIYSLNLDQTKTISQIPTDNAFFKKWLVTVHDENQTFTKELQNKLNTVVGTLSALSKKIDTLETTASNSAATTPKNNVETSSI